MRLFFLEDRIIGLIALRLLEHGIWRGGIGVHVPPHESSRTPVYPMAPKAICKHDISARESKLAALVQVFRDPYSIACYGSFPTCGSARKRDRSTRPAPIDLYHYSEF